MPVSAMYNKESDRRSEASAVGAPGSDSSGELLDFQIEVELRRELIEDE